MHRGIGILIGATLFGEQAKVLFRLFKVGLQQNLWVKFRICSGNAGRRVPLPLDPRTAETTCFMG